jgi:hypothetical protein
VEAGDGEEEADEGSSDDSEALLSLKLLAHFEHLGWME